MSLLEKAKSISLRQENSFSDEEIELALAWLKGEVTRTQINKVLGKNLHVLYWTLKVLKCAFIKGRLKIEDKS